MKWHDAAKNPPDNTRDVLISDCQGFFNTGFYDIHSYEWHGFGCPGKTRLPAKYWAEIDPPTEDNICS